MAGTNRKRAKPAAPAPIIILVEPQLPENIGMAARAMANFGLWQLRLVRPREKFPNPQAVAAASKADALIEKAVIFDNLPAAIADLHYVLATTARERSGFKPVLSAIEAARQLRHRQAEGGDSVKTGILFGRERFGLSNEELSLADALVTFPVNPAFASLNIAQAVLLMSYEWLKSGLNAETQTVFRGPEFLPARKQSLHGLLRRLEEALAARGYFRPPARKPVMVDNLRAVLTRPAFTEAEVKLLSGVFASLDRFARKKSQSGPAVLPETAVDKQKHDKAQKAIIAGIKGEADNVAAKG
ncbi:MAG: RNA methyltransferase [Candidatus Tokpelaia sp.]|nr:MAG: RNA methyltransferase [Candidatus Tokpelaia sp.]KAA6207658.1 MAG: RNA methyltransferase [Candidatus Tokpelaia sp.]